MYGLSIGDKSGDVGWTLAYFSEEQKFSTRDISDPFCPSATKFGNVGVWPIETYSPNFLNFGPVSRDLLPFCDSPSLIVYPCKVIFRQLPYVCGWFLATAWVHVHYMLSPARCDCTSPSGIKYAYCTYVIEKNREKKRVRYARSLCKNAIAVVEEMRFSSTSHI